MKTFVNVPVVICLVSLSGCSPRGAGDIRGTRIEEANQPVEDRPQILNAQKLDVAGDYLSLDYIVHNPFDHDIWVCDDLHIRSKNRVSERDAETRITDGTLWIRLHKRLERNFFGDPVISRYRRVPSGNSVSEILLLPLPVTNDSPVYAFGHRNDVRAVAHRVVFELGYFEENLPSLLSQWGDPNAVLISDWWERLDLERTAQVVIVDVNVPVSAPPASGASQGHVFNIHYSIGERGGIKGVRYLFGAVAVGGRKEKRRFRGEADHPVPSARQFCTEPVGSFRAKDLREALRARNAFGRAGHQWPRRTVSLYGFAFRSTPLGHLCPVSCPSGYVRASRRSYWRSEPTGPHLPRPADGPEVTHHSLNRLLRNSSDRARTGGFAFRNSPYWCP